MTNALHEYTAQRLWVTWRSEKRGGRPTKVPYSPTINGRASSTDPSTWATRAIVEHAVEREGYDGIGIVLAGIDEGRHLGGIDLDSCIDAEGNVAPWARKIVERVNSYTEISPSGYGLKIFFEHDPRETLAEGMRWRSAVHQPPPNGGKKQRGVEFYVRGRYFTVTDKTFENFDTVRHVGLDTLLEVQAKMEAFAEKPKPPTHHPRRQDDEQQRILDAIGRLPNHDLHWEDWNTQGMAIYAATGGSSAGYAAFLNWSARSSKYDQRACDERWQHWHTSPPDRLSAGTIFHHAGTAPPVSEHDGSRTKPANNGTSPAASKLEAAKVEATPEHEAEMEAAREIMSKAMLRDAVAGIEQAEKKRAASKQEVEAKIAELAKLRSLDYDLQRKEAAADLDLPVGRLDKHVETERGARGAAGDALPHIEPWPEPVSGVDVLNDIAAAVRRHVGVPTRGEEAIALWILFAHCFAAASISPRLAITSPMPECGKTTTLELIDSMVPRPVLTSSATGAGVYRGVEKWHPTLIIDEADTFLPSNPVLRGILNSGHKKSGAYVLLCIGDNHDATRLSTWCPMAVALIGKLHPTLSSRAIHIELQRLRPGETVEPFRSEKRPYAQLARKAARWAEDNIDALRDAEPELPKGFINRRGDNWRPLLAIADLVGGDWTSRARRGRHDA